MSYPKSIDWYLDLNHPDGFRVDFLGTDPYCKWTLKNRDSEEKIIIYAYELYNYDSEFPTRSLRFYDFAETPWGDLDVKSVRSEWQLSHTEDRSREYVRYWIDFY